MSKGKEYMSLTEFAERIGKNKNVAKRFIEAGAFPFIRYIKIDNRTNFIIPREAVDRFMKGENL